MRCKLTSFLTVALLLFVSTNGQAQFWKKLKKKAEDAVINTADKKLREVLKTKKPSEAPSRKEEEFPNTNDNVKKPVNTKKETPLALYRNFKFIPGEEVIFFDDLLYEEIGEFPSKWDLLAGGVEIASLNKEKVIIPTANYANVIAPLFLTNDNYLGDEFTVEFDIYLDNLQDINNWQDVKIHFVNNIENYKLKGSYEDILLTFRNGKTSGVMVTEQQRFNIENTTYGANNSWHHIAISYYKKKLKIYCDSKRIGNIPNFNSKITGLAINMVKPVSNNESVDLKTAIKNIRIAHGGGQMYRRIMADGKYVTNGILFDSGKAVIKPQSMGVINKIVNVLKEKPEWKFEIIGHTDNDGSAESNQILSEKRAEAVKAAIVAQGIAENRLTTIGKGASVPLNKNANAIQKANNRRVAFIRK